LGVTAAPAITTLHSRCLTPLLARLAATAAPAPAFFWRVGAAGGAGRDLPPLFLCASAALARSGESDLARLGLEAGPSRRTFSSAAANGSKPLCCFLPPTLVASAAAADDVGDAAAEAPAE
jgi:hypothetical protein